MNEVIEKLKKMLRGKTADEQFKSITDELNALYARKNEDYGGEDGMSVAEQMYKRYGDEYFVKMLMQKVLRIENVSKNEKVNFESILDNYRDIANYAIMAIMFHNKMS